MRTRSVEFQFVSGLKRLIFRNARLRGSWDGNGGYSDSWSEIPMQEKTGSDGSSIFSASVVFNLVGCPKSSALRNGILSSSDLSPIRPIN
jgi:1,4-alpha-glucan branching enzyme